MSTHLVHVTARSPLDRTALWRQLADSNRWRDWAPADHVRRPGANTIDQPGQVRTVVTGKHVVRETILWVGTRSVAYTVESGVPVKDYVATVRFVAVEDGTLIDWRAQFRPSVPGTGGAIERRLRTVLKGYADALAAAGAAESRAASYAGVA